MRHWRSWTTGRESRRSLGQQPAGQNDEHGGSANQIEQQREDAIGLGGRIGMQLQIAEPVERLQESMRARNANEREKTWDSLRA